MRKFFVGMVSLFALLLPSISLAAADFVMPFKDVDSGSYYYAPVKLALEKKVLVSGSYFYPSWSLTRAEFITWTVAALGIEKVTPEKPSFSDVPKTSKAYSSIETGKKFGLVSGTQTADGKPTGKFEPNALVNRAQAAVMIMKAFTQVKAGSASFPDLKNVGWAEEAIKKAASVGFFAGNPDKTFRPANNILRAEGITVLMKVASKLESKELTKSFATATSAGMATTVGTGAKTYTADELLKKIEAAFPGYTAMNIKQAGNYAVFYADKSPQMDKYGEPIYGETGGESKPAWHRLSLADANPKAEMLFETGPMGFLQGALSPDGKDFLITLDTGDVTVMNVATLAKTSLGNFTVSGKRRFDYPAYSPDGKYMLFFDFSKDASGFSNQNGILVVDASLKNLANGTFVAGFWLNEGGGGPLEAGITLSQYTFVDATHVTFNHATLNLGTMKKE